MGLGDLVAVSKPWLIVGLGNPGGKYSRTRHNVGEDAVLRLAEDAQLSFRSHRSGMVAGKAYLGYLPGGRPADPAFLGYPTSYMNLSGPPVAGFMRSEGIPVDRLLVVHDDLDLPAHSLRLKRGGGEGGHNGLRSITGALGTRDYYRLRIGVGRPPHSMDPAAYVLAKIPKKDWVEWDVTIQVAADAAGQVVARGFQIAQQDLHRSQS